MIRSFLFSLILRLKVGVEMKHYKKIVESLILSYFEDCTLSQVGAHLTQQGFRRFYAKLGKKLIPLFRGEAHLNLENFIIIDFQPPAV